MTIPGALRQWGQALGHPASLWQLGALALCLAGAWLVVRGMARVLGPTAQRPERGRVLLGTHVVDGVLFPAVALVLAFLVRLTWSAEAPTAVLDLGVAMLTVLLAIRLVVRVLRVVFPSSNAVRLLERSVSWLLWIVLVMWVTGLLDAVTASLDSLHWTVGGTAVTARDLIEGAFSSLTVVVVALWLSSAIESRLMATARWDVSLRKMAANAVRGLLLIVGVLIALSVAGIPLAALGVVGGAIGVGIGFGLQKLASNYISGFVILAERSLRIGDNVRIDSFEGRVTDISMRYTVVRALSGRESIVPNEMLVTQRVENLSYADRRVLLQTVVQVAYGTDLDALQPKLMAAVGAVPRVLADPGPGMQLSSFAADGLELTVSFWVLDVENGQGNVRSDVNRALLRLFDAEGIEIPFPQRVLQPGPGWPVASPSAAAASVSDAAAASRAPAPGACPSR